MDAQSQPTSAPLQEKVDALLQSARRQFQLQRRADAQRLADEAVELAPRSVQALNLRGMLFDADGRLDDARADFERVLALDPDNADALTNRAIVHARLGEYAQALVLYDRSLSIQPEQPHAIYNRSVILLARGDWVRGFREFESRWRIFPHEAARLTRLAPAWHGQVDIRGKTILLHHEQGYGDSLQFARYVPLVAGLGARVIVAMPAGLHALMKTLPGAPEIIAEGAPIPAHDFHCPLMSLPLAFRTTPETVPALVPYLRAETPKVLDWQQRLSRLTAPRIGLVWTGRRYPPINHARDMPLEALRPLLATNASFVVLQTELTEDERSLLANYPRVFLPSEKLVDFSDTAALIESLDLVITVDTAVAHLAGALGKPVWIMNRFASCWRWLERRPDSPWYPTLRLFRQPALGDWASVVKEITQATEKWMKENASHEGSKPKKPKRPGKTPAKQANSDSQVPGLLQEALAHHARGQWSEALAAYRSIPETTPDHPAALHYLGVALAQQADFEAAVESLSQAARMTPKDPVVHNHLGNALAGLRHYADAQASYQRSLALKPDFADAHYNLGVVQTELGEESAAISSFERALALKPDYPEAHNNLGNLLSESERRGEALQCYEEAIRLRPGFVDALVNRTNWLRRLHRYHDALAACEAALKLAPENAPLNSSRGATLAALGRDDEAAASYQRALGLDPGLAEASWNLGLLHLARGDYRAGWPLYEFRWRVKSLRLIRKLADRAAWSGSEPIEGKTILLHAEQGYGDTIQFARYARLLAARGARVLLAAPTALRPFLQSMAGLQAVVAPDTEVSFDLHCSLLSVPLAVGTEMKTIPSNIPYLFPDPKRREHWGGRLGEHRRPRIGLAWSGRPTHANDANRSVALSELLPLLKSPCDWVSLQRDVRASDAEALARTVSLRRFGEELSDFADTAALIAALDLVITVDTAVAHVAGALGKPVWILLPEVADWRWLQGRADSPWYASARLYRQHHAGDWSELVGRVAENLVEFTQRFAR